MICPRCYSEMLPLLWGYPSPFAMDEYSAGRVAIGGCILPNLDETPNYRCPDSGEEAFGPDWEVAGVFGQAWVRFGDD